MIETPVAIDLELPPPRKGRRWVRALLMLICALLATMWVYAFVFAKNFNLALTMS